LRIEGGKWTWGEGDCYMVDSSKLGSVGDIPWYCIQYNENGQTYPCGNQDNQTATDKSGKLTSTCTAYNAPKKYNYQDGCVANGTDFSVTAALNPGCKVCSEPWNEGGDTNNGTWPCFNYGDEAPTLMCGDENFFGFPCTYTIAHCNNKFKENFQPEWCAAAYYWCKAGAREVGMDEQEFSEFCNAGGFTTPFD